MTLPTSEPLWNERLCDPSGNRENKPRQLGKTMVIDKGLGIQAFEDFVISAGAHIDMIKIGFGTSPLYPTSILMRKIELAKEHDILIYPGGTFLEIAVLQDAVDSYFDSVCQFGFNAIEVSDGTIELPRNLRSELITRGLDRGLRVNTEYGKKTWGSSIEIEELIETVHIDSGLGADYITIEARESGVGVGIFDGEGKCMDAELDKIMSSIPSHNLLLWEAPLKDQQVRLIQELGTGVHLGNIPPHEVITLEAMRRGLRSDTLVLAQTMRERKEIICKSISSLA
ncbi:phosphosulfolactate synthase [Paenibacillus sp. N1-5-1-14]|uniref:phosphosulfolactate synthase n=1 Tax=Paenibacillus radicibacter TaxID=2972488 RepID=UPI002159AD6A|nr:phosphosulfolactate synthase [Paenibacillus radicibacter]MCR8642426.1 phosphosulfolactate synthase [Paenibacillus radicibacter]